MYVEIYQVPIEVIETLEREGTRVSLFQQHHASLYKLCWASEMQLPGNVDEALEHVFRHFQRLGPGSGHLIDVLDAIGAPPMRSLSCGDVIVLEGKAYCVEEIGFIEITEQWKRERGGGTLVSKLDSLGYRVVLRPIPAEDGRGWLAEIPDLPGCRSDGKTAEEALRNVEAAKRVWMDAARRVGRQIPLPLNAAAGGMMEELERLLSIPADAKDAVGWVGELVQLLGKLADEFEKANRKYHRDLATMLHAALGRTNRVLTAGQVQSVEAVCRLLWKPNLTRDDAIIADQTLRAAGVEWLPLMK